MSNIESLTFGVEIETTIPARALRVGHYHIGVPVLSAHTGACDLPAPNFQGHPWSAQRDGSIHTSRDGHTPCEFVSPILRGEAGLRHLVEFVEFLRAIGAAVNPSCGLHVHVGIEGAAGGEEVTAYVERLARLAAFNAKALYAQTGTLQREKGMWCKAPGTAQRRAITKAKRTKRLADAAQGDRYQLLNLTNLTHRRTVEFRCFAGTLNTSKVLLHVFSALLVCVVARKTKTPATWDNRPLSGEKAVRNFLKVRPVAQIVSAPTFDEHFPRMLAKAFEMAGKYDTAQAALDALLLTRTATKA